MRYREVKCMTRCTCWMFGEVLWKCAWCNGWMCSYCYFERHDEVVHGLSPNRDTITKEA